MVAFQLVVMKVTQLVPMLLCSDGKYFQLVLMAVFQLVLVLLCSNGRNSLCSDAPWFLCQCFRLFGGSFDWMAVFQLVGFLLTTPVF